LKRYLANFFGSTLIDLLNAVTFWVLFSMQFIAIKNKSQAERYQIAFRTLLVHCFPSRGS